MHSSLLLYHILLFTTAVHAQFIAATIFAIEIAFEILSTVAEEGVVAEIATSAEIEMAEAGGALRFSAVNADRSATVIGGDIAEGTIFGSESAAYFELGEEQLSAVAGTKFLTNNFVWRGLRISENGGQRIWEPVITGKVKSGLRFDGSKLLPDGAATVIKRTADPGTKINYGTLRPAGGYKINIKTFSVRPRLASS